MLLRPFVRNRKILWCSFSPGGASSSFWWRSRFSCVSNTSCKSSFLWSTARAANSRHKSRQKNQQNNAEPMLKFFFFWMFYALNSSLKGNWILLQLGSCSIFIILANSSVMNSPSLQSLQRHEAIKVVKTLLSSFIEVTGRKNKIQIVSN